MAIGDQPTEQVHHEVVDTAMARVFDLGNILQLIKDGLDEGSLAQQDLVGERQQAIFHMGFEFRDQLESEGVPQLLNQRVRHIAFVGEDLAGQVLHQGGDGAAVVGIAGR